MEKKRRWTWAERLPRDHLDTSGQIWIGSTADYSGSFPTCKQPHSSCSCKAIPVAGKQDFLCARRAGGFWQFVNERIRICNTNGVESDLGPYPWKQAPTAITITAGCEDNRGNLFVGTLGNGIYRFDVSGGVTRIGGPQGLNHGNGAFVVRGPRRWLCGPALMGRGESDQLTAVRVATGFRRLQCAIGL